MAVKSNANGSVNPGVIAIAGIIILLVVGLLAWRNFGAESGPAHALTAQQSADQNWVKTKARESEGRFDRLSAADQQKMEALYGKMAPSVLKGNATQTADNY